MEPREKKARIQVRMDDCIPYWCMDSRPSSFYKLKEFANEKNLDKVKLSQISKNALCEQLKDFATTPFETSNFYQIFSPMKSFESNTLEAKPWLQFSSFKPMNWTSALRCFETNPESETLQWDFSRAFDPVSGDILTDFLRVNNKDSNRYNWITIIRQWPKLVSDLHFIQPDKKRAREVTHHLLEDFGFKYPIMDEKTSQKAQDLIVRLPTNSQIATESLIDAIIKKDLAKIRGGQPTNAQLWQTRHFINDMESFRLFNRRGLQLENDRLFLVKLLERNPRLFNDILDETKLRIDDAMLSRIEENACNPGVQKVEYEGLVRKVWSEYPFTLEEWRDCGWDLASYLDTKKTRNFEALDD